MPSYLQNVWYMAGWSEDLTERILSCRIFERPMALFRASDGSVKAVADRCPHRFAPLSRARNRRTRSSAPITG